MSKTNLLKFIFLYFSAIFAIVQPAQTQTEMEDIALLERAIAKQKQILGHVQTTAHYQSNVWGLDFIVQIDEEGNSTILQPKDLDEAEEAAIHRRIEEDEFGRYSVLDPVEEEVASASGGLVSLRDLTISEADGVLSYDFFTTVDFSGEKEVTDRVRTTIKVDRVTELVVQSRQYNIKKLSAGRGVKVSSLEIITDFEPLEGYDASKMVSYSSHIGGRAFLIQTWNMDYKITYSDTQISAMD